MGDTFFENLFYKQEKQFEKINDLSKAFAVNYCGNTIIRESIFGIVSNYARKRELALEVLRYPFRDYLCEEGYDFLVCEYRTANV